MNFNEVWFAYTYFFYAPLGQFSVFWITRASFRVDMNLCTKSKRSFLSSKVNQTVILRLAKGTSWSPIWAKITKKNKTKSQRFETLIWKFQAWKNEIRRLEGVWTKSGVGHGVGHGLPYNRLWNTSAHSLYDNKHNYLILKGFMFLVVGTVNDTNL